MAGGPGNHRPRNAAVGAGSCVGNGKTTFQSFIAELQATHVAAKWVFLPSMLELDGGRHLVAMNLGSEQHTFTRVAQFGGGILPMLNAVSNNPVGGRVQGTRGRRFRGAGWDVQGYADEGCGSALPTLHSFLDANDGAARRLC